MKLNELRSTTTPQGEVLTIVNNFDTLIAMLGTSRALTAQSAYREPSFLLADLRLLRCQ